MVGVMCLALFGLLAVTGVCAIVSDVRTGLISNRLLGIVALCGAGLDAVLYGVTARGYSLVFIVNVATVIGTSIVLFCTHVWAGGDTKLACTCAILAPAMLYVDWFGTKYTLIAAVIGSFLLGYMYLLVDALQSTIRGKKSLSWASIETGFLRFAISYAQVLVYLVPVNLACITASAYAPSIPALFWIAVDFVAAWVIAGMRFLRRPVMLVAVLTLDVALCIWMKRVLLGTNILMYLAVLLVALSRIVLTQNMYLTIPTETVKPGMILSMSDTLEFRKSHIRGLPVVSTEDLRSRLSNTEADSVRRWGNTDQGRPYVTVVRKIPMAVFIVAAFVAYIVVGWIQ